MKNRIDKRRLISLSSKPFYKLLKLNKALFLFYIVEWGRFVRSLLARLSLYLSCVHLFVLFFFVFVRYFISIWSLDYPKVLHLSKDNSSLLFQEPRRSEDMDGFHQRFCCFTVITSPTCSCRLFVRLPLKLVFLEAELGSIFYAYINSRLFVSFISVR